MRAVEDRILSLDELSSITGGVYRDGARYLVNHTVAQGETLSRLATQYNTTIDKIMARNPIITDKSLIRVGWLLQIMVNDR